MTPTFIPFIAVISVMGILFGAMTYNLIQNIQACQQTEAELDRLEKKMLEEGLPFLSYKLRGFDRYC